MSTSIFSSLLLQLSRQVATPKLNLSASYAAVTLSSYTVTVRFPGIPGIRIVRLLSIWWVTGNEYQWAFAKNFLGGGGWGTKDVFVAYKSTQKWDKTWTRDLKNGLNWDPNTGLIWYSDHGDLSDSQMVHYLSAIMVFTWWSKFWSCNGTLFDYWTTIWKADI